MDRRTFLKSATVGAIAVGIAKEASAVEKYFPTKVDQSLFETINRVKDPLNKTPLEKSHAPERIFKSKGNIYSGPDKRNGSFWQGHSCCASAL